MPHYKTVGGYPNSDPYYITPEEEEVLLDQIREERTGMTHELPDGSGFFVAEIDTSVAPPRDPIMWNPWNKVVQDHRDGAVHHDLTNAARAQRGLPVPWTPDMADVECREAPVA